MKSKSAFCLVRTGLPSACILAAAIATLLMAQSAPAANIYWDGTGSPATGWEAVGNWDTAADGSGGDPAAVPGAADVANFSISTLNSAQTVKLNGDRAAQGLVFLGTNTAATNLLGGNADHTLTLGTGGITVNSLAGAVTLGSASAGQYLGVTLSAAQNWTNSSANPLTVQNAVNNGGFLLTVNGTGSTTLNGALIGAGGLAQSGSGVLTLTGSSTYSGATTVAAGSVLNIQNALALGTTGAGTTVSSGAALQLQGNIVALNEGLTLSGTGIAGDGALRNISGVNSFTGNLTLAGATRINSDAGMLLVYGTTTNGANLLTLGGAGNISVVPAIGTGAGGLTKDGAGTLGLFGANTYTGTTTLSSGTTLLGATEIAGTSGPLGKSVAANPGSIVFGGGTLQYSPQNNTDYSGRFATTGSQPIKIDTNSRAVTFATNLVGAGTSLAKSGFGTLTLTGTGNTYDGGTTVTNGTLLLSGTGNMPATGALAVNAGGTFSLADGTARVTTTAASLNLANGATLALDWNAGALDMLTSTAAATVAGNIGIVIANTSPSGAGGTLLASAAGGLTSGGASYFLANNTNFTATLTATNTAVSIGTQTAGTALVNNAFWYGNTLAGTNTAGVDNAMALSNGTVSNWSTTSGSYTATGLVPGATANVVFSATGATQQSNVVLGADMTINSITFNDTTSVTLNGPNALTLLSTGTGASSAISTNQDTTINAGVILGANQTWTTAAGKTLTLGGTIGNVTAGAGLTLAGAGTVAVNGTAAFSGATTVNNGATLSFAAGSNKTYLGSGNTLVVSGTVNVAGIVDVENFGGNGLNGVLNVTGSGALTLRNAPGNGDVAAAIGNSGYGMLNLTSGAVNVLGGSGNTYGSMNIENGGNQGLLRITGGVLNVGQMMIARNGGGTSEFTITAGAFNKGGTAGLFDIGDRGGFTSVLNVAGGLLDNTNAAITLGRSGGTAGAALQVVNFDAGTMLTKEFSGAQAGIQTIINFNGGTVKASPGISTSAFTPAANATGSITSYVNGAFGTFAGGIVFDTNGNSTTLNGNLLAPTGNGVTSLALATGGSGYTGAPIVTLSDSGTTQASTTVAASSTITMASTTGVFVGQAVTGTGIPAGSIVTAVTPNTSITISQAATAAGSPTLTFKGQGATAYANVSAGAVTDFVVTNPGVGYVGTVTATLGGGFGTGGSGTVATLNAITPVANTSGGLTKNGAGTLTLSGANTFTGAITVNGGTLAFGAAGITSYGNSISGAGAVSQTGTGTTVLTGTDTYGGVTTLTAGVLQLNSANALPGGIATAGGTSDLIFSGGALGLGNGDFTRSLGTVGTGALANFTGAGGWAAYGADRVVNLGGALATITWATANTGFNGQTLMLGAATATNTVDLQNPLDLGNAARTVQVDNGSATIDGKLSGVLSGTGGGITKTGLGTLALSNSGNAYTGTTAINAGTLLISGAATLGNGANLTLGGGALDLGTSSQTVGAVSITAAAASGDTIKNGSLVGTSYAASLASGNALVSANLLLNGVAGFAKTGAGTVTLSGANTYTGATSVSAGFLQFNSPGAIGGTGNTVTVTSPGTLVFGPAFGTIQGTLTGRVVSSSTGVIAADNHASENLDFSGAGANLTAASLGAVGSIAYTGTLTPNGTTYRLGGGGGTLTLSNANAITGVGNSLIVTGNVTLAAANDYSAGTTLSSGTLALASNSSIGAGPLALNGGTIQSTTSTARSLANILAIGGSVTVGGTGDMTFSDTSATALGATRTFTINNTTSTFDQGFSGATFGITKAGAGTLVLAGTDTYTGTTTVSGGVLRANDGTGLPTGSLLTINGGVIETGTNLVRTGGSAAGNMQITGGTSGFSANGGAVQVAIGTLGSPTALTWGTAPFQPGTFILNGVTANNTLEFKNAISLVNSARTIEVDANVATLSGVISGTGTSGTLTKTGLGTLVLNAADSYTGLTTVALGTLKLNGATGSLSATTGLFLGVNNTTYAGGSAFIYDNAGASGATSQTLASLASQNSQPNDNTVQLTRTAAQPVTLTFTTVTSNVTENGNVINFVTNDVAGGGVNGTDYKIALGSGLSALVGAGAASYYNITSQNAYFNGGDFAVYDPAGFVRGIKYGSDSVSATSAGGASFANTTNQQITGDITAQTSVTLGTGGNLGTLKIVGTSSITMLNSSQTISFSNGGNAGANGILKTGGGTSTISGGSNVTFNAVQADVRVDGATDVLNIAMPLNFTGNARFLKSGAGNLTLSSGTTTFKAFSSYIDGGVLEIGGSATLAASATASNLTIAPGASLKHSSSSTASILGGVVAGQGSVTVSNGTLTLSNANTYTGGTTVSGGSLLVTNTSGSATGTAAVNVGASGNFGGTGMITGALNVSGTLSPGASSIGTLTSGALSFANNSTYQYQVNSSVATSAGADLHIVNGALSLGGSVTLNLSDLGVGTFAPGTVFSLFNYSTGLWNSGLLTYNSTVLAEDSTFNFAGKTWTIDYDATAKGANVAAAQAGNYVNISIAGSADAYTTWIQTPAFAIPAGLQGPNDDPDGDGATNLEEFAFGGIPNDPTKTGLVFGLQADSNDPGTAKEMILTIAVRNGVTFSTPGSPAVSDATVDGLNYSIQGSTDLNNWTAVVTPVPLINPGLPALPTGYQYVSFSLNGSDGLPGKGFLRAKVVRP